MHIIALMVWEKTGLLYFAEALGSSCDWKRIWASLKAKPLLLRVTQTDTEDLKLIQLYVTFPIPPLVTCCEKSFPFSDCGRCKINHIMCVTFYIDVLNNLFGNIWHGLRLKPESIADIVPGGFPWSWVSVDGEGFLKSTMGSCCLSDRLEGGVKHTGKMIL